MGFADRRVVLCQPSDCGLGSTLNGLSSPRTGGLIIDGVKLLQGLLVCLTDMTPSRPVSRKEQEQIRHERGRPATYFQSLIQYKTALWVQVHFNLTKKGMLQHARLARLAQACCSTQTTCCVLSADACVYERMNARTYKCQCVFSSPPLIKVWSCSCVIAQCRHRVRLLI